VNIDTEGWLQKGADKAREGLHVQQCIALWLTKSVNKTTVSKIRHNRASSDRVYQLVSLLQPRRPRRQRV
jgi:hypothetical protein